MRSLLICDKSQHNVVWYFYTAASNTYEITEENCLQITTRTIVGQQYKQMLPLIYREKKLFILLSKSQITNMWV